MFGEVVGWVQRRHERKRTLGRIPLGFVVDVVKDQPVQSQRTKTSDSHVGDLLCSVRVRRETRRGQSKEQELALAGIDAADQVHGRDGNDACELRTALDAAILRGTRPPFRAWA